MITCYDPATGKELAVVPSLSAAEVKSAVDRAEAASVDWRRSSFETRRRMLRTLLDWLLEHTESIVRVALRDTGKTHSDAVFGEILTTASKLRWVIDNCERVLSPDRRSTNLLLAHKISHVHYEALGVIGACVSWNYSLHNLLSPVIAAIATGNAIVVKASEQVAWSTALYARAISDALAANGVDPNVVQVLVGCEAEAAHALVSDERLEHLLFIGSEEIGRRVGATAGAVGTQFVLEAGGKDPMILLRSAAIETFADIFMRSVFQSAGQNCIGAEAFIVHGELYDRFIALVEPRVRDLQVGCALDDPPDHRVDVGAMVSDRNFDRVEGLIADAVKAGARLLVGGHRFKHPRWPSAHYFEPTLIVDVTTDMEISRHELFSPVMLVMRAASADEAIRIANATRFGLGANVFGRDKAECQRVARELRCGMVAINDFASGYLNQANPFGGCRGSGFGRFGGPEGLRSLCNIKVVTRDRFHGIIQTSIPPRLRFPTSEPDRAWRFLVALVRLGFAPLSSRIRAVFDLATA